MAKAAPAGHCQGHVTGRMSAYLGYGALLMFPALHKVKVFGSCSLPIQCMDCDPCFSLGLSARGLPTPGSCCSLVGSVRLLLALCSFPLRWPPCQHPSLFELPGRSGLTREEAAGNPALSLHCVCAGDAATSAQYLRTSQIKLA